MQRFKHPTLHIGISACLTGKPVRYNGGKAKFELHQTLKTMATITTVCPEVSIGLGVPRPVIKLMEHEHQIHLVDSKQNDIDHTEKMISFANQYLDSLDPTINGFIVKRGSPSCALHDAKVSASNGQHTLGKQSGLFTQRLLERHPHLPVEDEGRLNDTLLRENFFQRIYIDARWKQTLESLTAQSLLDFHQRHKLLIMSHSPAAVSELGKKLADLHNQTELLVIANEYYSSLYQVLKTPAKRRRITTVLQHAAGYLKKCLSSEERQSLAELILEYHDEKTPLLSVITLLGHFIDKYDISYLKNQYFLEPYPNELRLRLGI